MQAITLRRECRTGVVAPHQAEDDELLARLRPLVDIFADRALERIEMGQGPLVYTLPDRDGLPTTGVISDPGIGRRTRFRLPIAGEVVA